MDYYYLKDIILGLKKEYDNYSFILNDLNLWDKNEDLRKIGVVLKRAQYFITCNGKYYGDVDFDEPLIRNKLSPKEDLNILENQGQQLNFFDFPVLSYSPAISKVDDLHSSVLGQL